MISRFLSSNLQVQILMSIDNPEALVEAFKNSGEFERFQKELLAEFQKYESYSTFKADIGDIVRKRLAEAQMFFYLPQDMVGKELTQEVERYPVVDRAVKAMRMFSDPAFHTKIQNTLQRILQEDMQKRKSSAGKLVAEMELDDDHDFRRSTIRTGNSATASNTHETGRKVPPDADDTMDVDNN